MTYALTLLVSTIPRLLIASSHLIVLHFILFALALLTNSTTMVRVCSGVSLQSHDDAIITTTTPTSRLFIVPSFLIVSFLIFLTFAPSTNSLSLLQLLQVLSFSQRSHIHEVAAIAGHPRLLLHVSSSWVLPENVGYP